eukprot:CAMPEP_0118932324 /NCGR_PEP_ID=MMETSP1169-20130426/9865_1 /TAXON_ID=36882 /ORGANISM="Pyramimonas obovata, Strain CCMP722" /LENGTH=144 /DNA_ID=CAMNT_0006874965 /DNA_START=55 /DNA_END=489 /DNA_ORIENTATION=+
MEHKVSDRRVIIYPPYLNSKLKVKEGRRIPVELACENPSCHEVFESVLRLNFKAVLEDKCYSRDYMQRGRIRVEFKNENGEPVNPAIPTRRALLIEVGKLVPTTMARKKRGDPTNIDEPIVLQGLLKPKEEKLLQKNKGGKKKK